MTSMINLLYSSMVFWVAWIIIPLMMEIIPTFFNFLILLKRKIKGEGNMELKYMPEITLIIPVYNSAETLYQCIKSVYDSNYDNKMIYIMAIDNMSTDNSFEVFCKCQRDYPELTINWMSSKQGKSKALNLALFNSSGKYIIHVDSDGVLHPDAIRNIVAKFENNEDVYCVTGAIMTNPDRIDESKGFFRRLFLKMEFFEYCQAFLAGRNFQSEYNSMFTLSGAFSAFRKSSILKTHLYNTDTICEDTHVTFQIRDNLKEDEGVIDEPIGRDRKDRKRRAVNGSNAKRAVTHYRVLERFGGATLVECRLETGRTHQIRVHMAYIGHPLLGDSVYGRGDESVRVSGSAIKIRSGQMLHAGILGFVHPRTGEYMEFKTDPPEDFTDLLEKLRKMI